VHSLYCVSCIALSGDITFDNCKEERKGARFVKMRVSIDPSPSVDEDHKERTRLQKENSKKNHTAKGSMKHS